MTLPLPPPQVEELRTGLARVEREIEKLLATPDPLLGAALAEVLARPAKRLRPLLSILGAMASAGRAVDATVFRGAAAVEILHLASLVHDDVIDESPRRSNRPTPHTIWGNHRAVLLGDFLFARALLAACRIGRACFLRFVTVAEDLVRGEFGQTAMAGVVPSVHSYFQWIEAKTARLFALAASPGREVIPALVRYGHALGMAYQLRDDLLDLIAEEEWYGKPVGNDSRRGIYTYPLILASAQAPALRDLIERGRPEEPIRRQRLKEILWQTGALVRTEEDCRTWAARAMEALTTLPPTPAREALVALAGWGGEIPRRGKDGQGNGRPS
ncbi:MAG: polyprenyl synthetase family protein [Firmicutes bacterium]|nr:polyprenyl synthetase family protein [Bacillota bacterium]